MPRFAALALAAAALAAPLATAANAEECVGNGPIGACYVWQCGDHRCSVYARDYTFYSHCEHPMPTAVCLVWTWKLSTPGALA